MRITHRMLAGFVKAHKQWISDNDEYNKREYGITKAQYGEIRKAVIEITGGHGELPSLQRINRELLTAGG